MCKNLICVCIFGKSLNTFQNFQKSLYEKYKFTTLYFSKTPLKKFFRRPAAGDLDKPGRNNPVGLVAGNHTGLFYSEILKIIKGREGARGNRRFPDSRPAAGDLGKPGRITL